MVHPRSAAMIDTHRSARAEIVHRGLTPRLVGTVDPSQIYLGRCGEGGKGGRKVYKPILVMIQVRCGVHRRNYKEGDAVAITNEDALGAGSVLATVIRFPAEGVQFSGVTFKLHQSHAIVTCDCIRDNDDLRTTIHVHANQESASTHTLHSFETYSPS